MGVVGVVKPEGWLDDETEYVADPEAERPADWDEEEDGEWEAPMVPNAKVSTGATVGEAWPATLSPLT